MPHAHQKICFLSNACFPSVVQDGKVAVAYSPARLVVECPASQTPAAYAVAEATNDAADRFSTSHRINRTSISLSPAALHPPLQASQSAVGAAAHGKQQEQWPPLGQRVLSISHALCGHAHAALDQPVLAARDLLQAMEAWAGKEATLFAAAAALHDSHTSLGFEAANTAEEESMCGGGAQPTVPDSHSSRLVTEVPSTCHEAGDSARDSKVRGRQGAVIPGGWTSLLKRLARSVPAAARLSLLEGGAQGLEEWMADEAESRLPEILRQRPKVCVRLCGGLSYSAL